MVRKIFNDCRILAPLGGLGVKVPREEPDGVDLVPCVLCLAPCVLSQRTGTLLPFPDINFQPIRKYPNFTDNKSNWRRWKRK
jgi:hypothetical protein